MYLEVLAADNYISVNRKLAQLFDLKTAVYIAELSNIITKVYRKKTFDEQGFFQINREYITERTTLSLEDQLVCDSVLTKVGVLEEMKDDSSRIRMDIELLTSIITSEDTKLLSSVAKKCKVSKVKKSEAKVQAIRQSLKAGIIENDSDILKALCDWTDAILDSKNFLSKRVIEIFQDQLNQYTTDKDTKIAIITLATVHAYKDVGWAIQLYEKSKKQMPKRNFKSPQVSDGFAENVTF